MSGRHALKVFRVKLKGEIYDRVYGVKDLEYVLDLFNEINGISMKVIIEEKVEEDIKE